MASSTAPASHAEPLPGPPPAPTSLLDLPAPWLLQLVTSSAFDGQGAALLALFRTCSFFRDTILRSRTAAAVFYVPITSEAFPDELERLCDVARRSSRVCLVFSGVREGAYAAGDWIRTEPKVTHLLVCAMAQLGGEQPLACVKEITLYGMEQTALVPAWVKVLCPNVAMLESTCNLTPHLVQQPMPHHPLQRLEWDHDWIPDEDPPIAEYMRQQLAALPNLTSLTLANLDWADEEDEQRARRLISSTVTELTLTQESQQEEGYQRLPTQFPCLRRLDAGHGDEVDDLGLDALLSMQHLEHLETWRFWLKRSHTHRLWRMSQLTVRDLQVDSFARLPLESIQACTITREVNPSTDSVAVARVARAIRRWGGLGPDWRIRPYSNSVAALLTTLGPLVAALPPAQQRRVQIAELEAVTSAQLRQLGQQLPASVTHLELHHCSLASDAWPALLPSLPASVVELRLALYVTEQQVLAMCQAAVRPIKVLVSGYQFSGLSQQDLDRIASSFQRRRGRSAKQQQQPGSLVTLVRE